MRKSGTSSGPLEVSTLLHQHCGQEVSEKAIDLDIMGQLGGKAFPGYCHFASIMSSPPCVSRQCVAAVDGITKGINDCPSSGNGLANLATGNNCRRVQAKPRCHGLGKNCSRETTLWPWQSLHPRVGQLVKVLVHENWPR